MGDRLSLCMSEVGVKMWMSMKREEICNMRGRIRMNVGVIRIYKAVSINIRLLLKRKTIFMK